MADNVKFTDEEMQKLAGLQQSYQNISATFGQLRVQRILLEQQMNGLDETEISIEEQYKTAQQTERDFVKELNDKYGPGTLDPATGTFTPAEPTETPTEAAEPTESTGAPK
tara:strand:- start:2052 stop:2384 length:333 start_codon:yes stop_codon:yes gene_type:complete